MMLRRHSPLITVIIFAQFVRLITCQDPAGYILPSWGTASTTQFQIGPEFGSGTSCGASAWPKGINAGNPATAAGPGFLYAAINQLAFGANPSVPNGGGPGAACGTCYSLTPMDRNNIPLPAQAMTFMIIDECPAAQDLQRGPGMHCNQCSPGSTNMNGMQWHFDIATDAMNQQQYDQFYQGVTNGANWNAVSFNMTSCSPVVNPDPPLKEWGCLHGCHNNDAVPVCQGVPGL